RRSVLSAPRLPGPLARDARAPRLARQYRDIRRAPYAEGSMRGHVIGFCLLLTPLAARAQSEPKFVFGKLEEVKQVEWKAQVKAGYLLTTGNSQSQNGAVT